ncbi:MAG: NAD(P)-binding domain-containing protein, partial [Ginsengibacter sp.]
MIIKQTIIIIGATGKVGSAIAKSLSKGNYRLLLNGRDNDKTNQLIIEIKKANPAADIEGIDCSFNGCLEADIIISAVPYAAEKDLAKKIKEVANQKIVISIANPLNENYDGLTATADTSAAEEFQKFLPNSKVVKAFNT